MKNKICAIIMLITICCSFMTGCSRQSERVSYNLKKEADYFNIPRKITVINSRSDNILLEFTAYMSIDTDAVDNQLEVTYQVGKDSYAIDYIRLNEWTTYVIEQLDPKEVPAYSYEIKFVPKMADVIDFSTED